MTSEISITNEVMSVSVPVRSYRHRILERARKSHCLNIILKALSELPDHPAVIWKWLLTLRVRGTVLLHVNYLSSYLSSSAKFIIRVGPHLWSSLSVQFVIFEARYAWNLSFVKFAISEVRYLPSSQSVEFVICAVHYVLDSLSVQFAICQACVTFSGLSPNFFFEYEVRYVRDFRAIHLRPGDVYYTSEFLQSGKAVYLNWLRGFPQRSLWRSCWHLRGRRL